MLISPQRHCLNFPAEISEAVVESIPEDVDTVAEAAEEVPVSLAEGMYILEEFSNLSISLKIACKLY